jgi:ATP-binding cassette subfamily A (ABC1) protein 3
MAEIRTRIGVCLQVDVLYSELTVLEHLQLYAQLKGLSGKICEDEVAAMLNKCGLSDESNKRTDQLSGGNKRKTCLACAAIGKSDLLFLDEPSSGLDPNSRKLIWELIK